MQTLLDILRDIYVHSVATHSANMLQEYIDKNCMGCVDSVQNQMGHDLCVMMSLNEQLSSFLPDILKKIKPTDINEAIRLSVKNDERKETLRMMLRAKDNFHMSTFLYICFKDMCADLTFQTRIASAVFAIRVLPYIPPVDVIQKFEKEYQKAIKKRKET